MFLKNKLNTGLVSLVILSAACNVHAISETKNDKPTSAIASVPLNQEKPFFAATKGYVLKAEVMAINYETRNVTLKMAKNDEIVTIRAKDRVANLDKVKVGDHVTAEYIENLSVEVVAVENAQAAAAAAKAQITSKTAPGVVELAKEVIVSTVEEINIEANTFKLKGPDGVVREYTAKNPENLKRGAVGDVVVVTHSEAFAVSVDVVAAVVAE